MSTPVSGKPSQAPSSGGGADVGSMASSIRSASGMDQQLEHAEADKENAMEGAAAETATVREAGSSIAQSADGKEAPQAPQSSLDATGDANKNASA